MAARLACVEHYGKPQGVVVALLASALYLGHERRASPNASAGEATERLQERQDKLEAAPAKDLSVDIRMVGRGNRAERRGACKRPKPGKQKIREVILHGEVAVPQGMERPHQSVPDADHAWLEKEAKAEREYGCIKVPAPQGKGEAPSRLKIVKGVCP